MALPTLDLTRDLRELATLAASEEPLDDLFRRSLEWLERLAPYDLATICHLEGAMLVVRAAGGRLATPRIRGHALALGDVPKVRDALELRRALAFLDPGPEKGERDLFTDVLELPPGHSCMLVPLCTAASCYGVLTLDREHSERYPPPVVDIVEVYVRMLALALESAERRAALERLRRQDEERARLLERDLGGATDGVLEDSGSPAVRDLARRARQVAATDTPVLIFGETGTGKEHLARAIHRWSPRSERPFVALNCAAIPPGLVESELFGHVRGAFTGATRDRPGRFQVANGGTILLDELGELPLDAQAKLLRVLAGGTFEPVGGDRTVKVDVRIVAATNLDLERAIAERRFREDLYYRLQIFPLRLPPLRERLEDLPRLAASLLSDQARRTGRGGRRVTADGLARLARYRWPGNIRELANVLERATILAPRREIGPEFLDVPTGAAGEAPRAPSAGASLALVEVERDHIRRVLALSKGKIYGPGGAAEALGLKPSTLQSRMKKLGIERVAKA